ncbi:MAG: outer membrane beta-barrel family protein [Dysgonamonadaceae bacterium]|jgi:hypothetical protein|nr:outer membrane beta-barrel family protein [Dysgonamonadaceae bacterium]
MKTILFSIFIFSVLGVSAQHQQVSLSGKITDVEGKPVAIASLTLYNTEDSTKSVSAASSSSGEFSLRMAASASAVLTVSHLVFEEKTLHLSLSKDTVLHLTLIPRSYLLDEVAVVASKPRYVIRDDGNMTVNVERIPGSENDNAFDLLKKLPGVMASDNQGISLHGMDIELQIDGRDMSYMDAMALLKALPAFSLSQVELISIKGAEHDGSSQAIINLKTKRQTIDGYFGMAGVGGRNYTDDTYLGAGQAFIMFKAKDITFSTTFSADYFKVKASGTDSTWFGGHQESIVRNGYQTDRELHLSNNSNLVWDVKPGQTLFANVSLFDSRLDRISESNYQNKIDNSGMYTAAKRDAPRFLVSGNVEYQLGSVLKMYYGYVRGNSSYDEDFENAYNDTRNVRIIHNEDNIEEQHIAKVDFSRKYLSDKLTVKAGTKATFAFQNNDSRYIPNTLDAYSDLAFDANENIITAYASLSCKISDKISATVGIRSEYTSYSIENISGGENVHPDYWNYLPHGHLNIRVTPWYSVTPYFTSSVRRPQYQALLPGKRYSDEYNYSAGNPYLQPIKSYSLAVSNTFFNRMNLRAGFVNYRDNFNNVRIDRGNGITETACMNVVDVKYFTVSASVPFSLFADKFSGNINYNLNKGKYLNPRNGFILPDGKNENNTMNLKGYFNFQVTPSIGVNSQVNYQIKNTTLQTEHDPYASLDLGLNMALLKSRQLSLTLSACDVFKSVTNRYKVYYDENVFVSDRTIPSQYVGLMVSWRFFGGKNFNKKDSETNDTNRFTK